MLTMEEKQYFTKITNHLGSIAESLKNIDNSLKLIADGLSNKCWDN